MLTLPPAPLPLFIGVSPLVLLRRLATGDIPESPLIPGTADFVSSSAVIFSFRITCWLPTPLAVPLVLVLRVYGLCFSGCLDTGAARAGIFLDTETGPFSPPAVLSGSALSRVVRLPEASAFVVGRPYGELAPGPLLRAGFSLVLETRRPTGEGFGLRPETRRVPVSAGRDMR